MQARGKPGFQLVVDAGRRVKELSPEMLVEILEEKDYTPDLLIERRKDGKHESRPWMR